MGEVHSLEQLPLNIIFQILTYLSIKDLRNVSQTCKVLRVLCNESITYNKYMKDAQSGRNPWARKLIHNLLAVYNSNDDLMAALSSRGKGASETLRYVYSCMNVGYAGLMHMLGYEGGSLRLEGRPEKLGRYQDLFYDGLPAGDNVHEDVSNLNEQDIEEMPVIEPGDQIDSAQYRNCGQDDGMATDLPRLVFNTNKGQFLKEVCKYQYLNAVRCSSFNHDSAHLYRATSSFENSKEYKWSEFSASRANSPKDALRSSELPMHRRCHTTCTPDSDTDTLSPDSLHFSVSPHSSIGRDSGSSIFSEIPKLSDSCNIQNWSLSYELDPVSDSSDLQHPNTERFLKQLKNPMKVKDKAVLFEMLMAQDVETHKIKKLTYDSFEESKRNIAHSYLEEVQRCNRSIEANFTKGSVDVLVHEQPAPNDMFTKPEVMTKSAVTNPTSSRTSTVRHRRRQLKAVVTDDNRICYERL